jgi:hypothetical protein
VRVSLHLAVGLRAPVVVAREFAVVVTQVATLLPLGARARHKVATSVVTPMQRLDFGHVDAVPALGREGEEGRSSPIRSNQVKSGRADATYRIGEEGGGDGGEGAE